MGRPQQVVRTACSRAAEIIDRSASVPKISHTEGTEGTEDQHLRILRSLRVRQSVSFFTGCLADLFPDQPAMSGLTVYAEQPETLQARTW
jgi:hypothetical protein